MRDQIIVALDVPWTHQGWFFATLLMPECTFFKVGMELFLDCNMSFIRQLAQNDRVMLDLKLADTPDTIRRSVERICRYKYKPQFLTVRGTPEVVAAARKGRGDNEYPKIIHVPRLSSEEDGPMDDYCLRQEVVALEQAGCDGYVASGRHRIPVVRKAAPDAIIISPGIRLGGQELNNHRHHSLPSEAIRLGANYVVVGRPIIEAKDSKVALKHFIEDLENVE